MPPDSEPEGVPAPLWHVGDLWIHRGINPSQGVDSLVRTEVIGVDEVHGERLYRVLVTGNFTGSPMEQYYNMDLNRAWQKTGLPCGKLPGGRAAECTGGDHWFEWPLIENRTWETWEGGDVPEGGTAFVTRANHGDGSAAFTISMQDRENGGSYARLITYAPSQGWYTLDVRYDDRGVAVSVVTLMETNYAAGGT